MTKETKRPGIGIEKPSNICNDPKCPFHGKLKIRGRTFTGKVISSKAQKTVTIEIPRTKYMSKYERYEKRRTRIKAHNPECINAEEGEEVVIMETRPISKTKNFVVVKKRKVAETIKGIDLTAKETETKKKDSKTNQDQNKKKESKNKE